MRKIQENYLYLMRNYRNKKLNVILMIKAIIINESTNYYIIRLMNYLS